MCLNETYGRLRHSSAQNPLVIAYSSPWLTVPITWECALTRNTPHLHIPQGWADKDKPGLSEMTKAQCWHCTVGFCRAKTMGLVFGVQLPSSLFLALQGSSYGAQTGSQCCSTPITLAHPDTWFLLKSPNWRSVLCNFETSGWLLSIWIKWMMRGVVFSFPRKWKWDPLFHISSSTEVRCHQQDYWALTISKRWFLGENAELAFTKDSVFMYREERDQSSFSNPTQGSLMKRDERMKKWPSEAILWHALCWCFHISYLR